MGKRLSYEEVKKFIEGHGYILISKEYISGNRPLRIKDYNGFEFLMTFYGFRRMILSNKKVV